MMMYWSNDAVIEFLEAYKVEPSIWDPTEINHKNRQVHAFAWKRICDKLSFECTIEELKKKKESLMASFRSQLRKKKDSIKLGDKIYEPCWHAFKLMESFLSGVYHCDMKIEGQTEQNKIFDPCDDEDDNSSEMTTEEIEKIEITDVKIEPCPKTSPNHNHKRTSNAAEIFPKRKKIKILNLPEKAPDESRNIPDDVAERKYKHELAECDMYAMLLAKKLKKFKEFDRETVMNQIDNLIFQKRMLDLETPDNNT